MIALGWFGNLLKPQNQPMFEIDYFGDFLKQ